MCRRLPVLAALFVLSSAVPCSWAEEGRIPVFEPTVFDAANGPISGRYVVTRDIAAGATGFATISFVGNGSEAIDLDLNGFTVRKGADVSNLGVISATGVRSFTVRNGSLVGESEQTGVTCPADCESVLYEDLVVSDAVTGVQINNAQNFAIRRCIIDTTDNQGILVAGNPLTNTTGFIEDSVLQNTGSESVLVYSNINGATVRNNRILQSQDRGIAVEGIGLVDVRDNQVEDPDSYGIDIQAEGCRIVGNVVSGSTADGIRVTSVGGAPNSSCLVSDNVSTGNGEAGVELSRGGNRVTGNILNSNAQYGLFFTATSDNNTYRLNSFVSNTLSCVQDDGTNNVAGGDNFFVGVGACP
ncbi:MAG: hypothetical protein GY716_23010 [bacterium]|nr:hypothetical protein [bacterium]